MPKPNSVIRKTHFRERQLPVVAETIKLYKSAGYKVVDSIEVVMLEEPNSTFRIFISRVSHSLQMYFLGEGAEAQELSTKYLDSAAQVVEEERKFKTLYG
jgi:hypothetical protein